MTADANAISPQRAIQMAFLVAGAFFMENLDGTVIATAIPRMAQSFHTSAVGLNIGITAYLLALAMFIPMSGWVADRFGARKVFTAALIIFTVSSVLCGFCNNLWEFTAARILQGFGGAMMVPVGRLVVLRSTPKRDLVTAVAYITWPGLVAPVVGPPLGGLITTYASWRWIFFLNVPLGIVAILFALLLIPDEHAEEIKPFDWTGFFLSGVACVLFIFGLDFVGRPGGVWYVPAGMVATSIVLGVLAVRHFNTHPHPLVDLSALRVPTFGLTVAGGSLFRIAIGATPFLLPLLFQVGFHFSPFISGLLVLAVFAGNLLMKPATTPILRRFGFRTTLIGNGILTAFTLWVCCFFTPTTPLALMAIALFAGGLCRSMQFTCLNTLGFADIPSSGMSNASSLSSTLQQITLAMGVAFGAIALRLSPLMRGIPFTIPSVIDFRVAFALVGVVAIASLFDCFRLAPDAGDEVSGHKPSLPDPVTTSLKSTDSAI